MKHPILTDDMVSKVGAILKSGELSMFRGTPEGQSGGKWVQALEEAFKEYFGVQHAVAMNSGTACLHSACVALQVKKAIVTPYSFVTSASCVNMAGGTPEFVDVDPDYFTMNPSEPAKVFIPVHLMGQPCDMGRIMSLKEEYVIEDCCQAIGAKYKGQYVGTIGDCGVFSFNQSKTISTGEGGILITNNDHIARVARAMRNHAEVSDPSLKIFGYNYRMCEVEARLALEQFKKLDKMNEWRRELCEQMTEKLGDIEGLTPPKVREGCTHVYYTYGIKYDPAKISGHRDKFQERMMRRGVYLGKGYVKPLYTLPVYGGQFDTFPVVEDLYKNTLMVTDIFRPPMRIKDVDNIVEIIKEEVCR